MNDDFHADLLRNPGPAVPPCPRRDRVVPIGYTLIFAVVFGLFTYVCLISWAIDVAGALIRMFGS